MAIYRFSAQVIKRSSGRSSVAAAAYRSAEKMLDERQGLAHDYSNRGGVLHCEVLLPEAAPAWMGERSQLWNAVELAEKRKDAQLSREVVLSLPHELTDESRRDLVVGFVQEHFVDRGMVADIAIHAPGAEGDNRNHHAHVMLTTRSVTSEGFGGKDRSWNDKGLLEQWREGWGHHANQVLEREGIEARLDHRSLKDRHVERVALKEAALERGDHKEAQEHEIEALGLDRDPLPHIGFKAWAMERRGVPTAIGSGMREVRERMGQVRDLVADLREGLSGVAERVAEATGLSQSLERLRGGLASAASLADGQVQEPRSGLGAALGRLRSSREDVGGDYDRSAQENIEKEREKRLEKERGVAEKALEKKRHERQLELERVQKLERHKSLRVERDYGIDIDL